MKMLTDLAKHIGPNGTVNKRNTYQEKAESKQKKRTKSSHISRKISKDASTSIVKAVEAMNAHSESLPNFSLGYGCSLSV